MLARAAVLHEVSMKEGSPSKFNNSCGCWQIHFSRVNEQRINFLLHGICPTTKWQLASSEQGHEKKMSMCMRELPVFCMLILEVAAHHVCCILFIGCNSLCPAPTQGQGTTQGCGCWEAGMIGSHVRSSLPQMSLQHLHEGSNSLCKPKGSVLR